MHTPPNSPNGPSEAGAPPVRLVGVGGAGIRLLGALRIAEIPGAARTGASPEEALLAAFPESERLVLGRDLTRGLGAGGDPVQGRRCAEVSEAGIREAVAGSKLVFVLAGLGGGTGSGAAPVIARMARESGALVLGLATLPFQFEGRLRATHAAVALDEFRAAADAVICIPNERVLSLLPERAPIREVFDAANDLAAEAIRGLARLLAVPGEIGLDFGHVERLLRGRRAEGIVASARGDGEHRTRESVERLLAHPFLNGGDVLTLADGVVLAIDSGPDLAARDIAWIVDQVQRQCDHAQVLVGTSVDPGRAGTLSITLMAARGGSAPIPESVVPAAADPGVGLDGTVPPAMDGLLAPVDEATQRSSARFVPPPPELTTDQKQQVLARSGRAGIKRRKPVQTLFNFDVVSKGRFEKTEATIHQGEDLDLPTFIRRGYALN